MKIDLLPNENVVMVSKKDILTLTTHRVRYNSIRAGGGVYLGITLSSVASCGLIMRSFPVLLYLAPVVAVIGLFWEDFEFKIAGVILGVLLVVIYFLTRHSFINIASNGVPSILASTKGMSRKNVIEFLEAVEREKLKQSLNP